MNRDLHCTDQDLQRFVDGELDRKARQRIDAFLSKDPVLAARVRDYRNVNEAVREAFDDLEPPAGEGPVRAMPSRLRGVAAGILILPAGFLAGWVGHSLLSPPSGLPPLKDGVSLSVPGRERINTVLHIDVDDDRAMKDVLDRAEAILAAYADRDVHVEVVANAAGLGLLRADTSPFAARVRQMMDAYDNLLFVACANTITRLEEQGVEVFLIDRTHSKETAIDHIVGRLRGGWTYVKI